MARYKHDGTCAFCGRCPRHVYEWDGVDICYFCAKEVLSPEERQRWFNAFVHAATVHRRRTGIA